ARQTAEIESLERKPQRSAPTAREVVDGAAIPQDLRPPRKYRRAATRQDDVIGAATGRELALGLRGDLEGAAGVGPQLAREDRTIGQRVSADDRRSRPFEQLNEQAADRSQTDDD